MKISASAGLFLILAIVLSIGCSSDDDDDDAVDDDDAIGDDDDDATDDDDSMGDDDDDDDDDDDTGEEPVSALYQVVGEDARFGDYAGTVEIRFFEEPNFIRVVAFDDLVFPDPRLEKQYEVHTAWTGTYSEGETPAIAVQLKVADFIKEYGALERTVEDGPPLSVAGTVEAIKSGQYFVVYETAPGSAHEIFAEETWTELGPGDAAPIFRNLDDRIPSGEPMPQGLHDLVFNYLADYHALEFFDDYRERQEFIDGVHFIAEARTDFSWQRENPDSIRVANKLLDEISMAEAMLRARSFGPTLAQKAADFDREMPLYYLNAVGIFSSSLHGADPPQLAESGDGLVWTACYLAGQAYRYLATGEPEAMDNWLRALDGLLLSHDLPQDPTTFGRAARPHINDGDPNWIQGAPPLDAYDWLCCGNNDMIQGLFYGYLISWIFLPQDAAYDAYRDRIAENAAILAEHSTVALDGSFNEIKASWLAFLTTGEVQYQQRYQALFSSALLRLYTRAGGGMFYLWGVSDWSGQSLNTLGHLILWHLAQATGDSSVSMLEKGWVNGLRMNRYTQTLWPIAAYSLVSPPSNLDEVLERAVWNLREVPYPKQSFDIDKRIDPEWCASPIPNLIWKFDYMQGGRHQGLTNQPMWGRAMHSNLWVPGFFDFKDSASDWTDGGGADFLHAYWMGRYYSVISTDD